MSDPLDIFMSKYMDILAEALEATAPKGFSVERGEDGSITVALKRRFLGSYSLTIEKGSFDATSDQSGPMGVWDKVKEDMYLK